MTEINRRRTLYLTGAGMAALAGCSGSSDEPNNADSDSAESDDTADGSTDQNPTDGADDADETDEYEGSIDTGELPSYASLLPETDRSEYFYGVINIETMFGLIDDEGNRTGDEPTDPLLINPNVFTLLGYDGVDFLSSSSTDETQLIYANDVYALVAEYDRESLETDFEEGGYEPLDGDESYTIYAHGETGNTVGITDEVFAFPDPNAGGSEFDPTTAIRRLLETAVGQREPKHATDDEFEWLLRAGGDGGITTGIYTDADEFDAAYLGSDRSDEGTDGLESDYGAFEGANGAHQQLVLADDNGARAGAVVTYADEGRVDVDRLESSLGTEADAVDVVRDGTAVSIDAEYAGDL